MKIEQIKTEVTSYMALEVNPRTCSIQIKWFRPISCDECARGVKVAARFIKKINKLHQKNYKLIQE